MTDNFATKCTPAAGLDQIAASDASSRASRNNKEVERGGFELSRYTRPNGVVQTLLFAVPFSNLTTS